MDERRTPPIPRSCLPALLALALGLVGGIALALAILGVGWGVLLGRVFSPATAPVVSASATATPRPQAMQGQVAPGRRIIVRAPIPLDSDTALPELLLASRNFERNASTLVLISPADGRVRWESPTLSEASDEYSWAITYGDEAVVVAVGPRLIGLSRASGEQRWEAPLSDSVAANICERCLRVFGDVVVALAQDGQLQAFSLASGAPRWSVRLNEAPRQIVDVGGRIGVPDREPERSSDALLRLFNPADGVEATPVRPNCANPGGSGGDAPGIYDPVYEEPRGRLLLWMIDSSPACILSLSTASAQLAGRVFIEEFSGYDIGVDQLVWLGDTLFVSDGDAVFAVEPGGARLLIGSEEYQLTPIGAAGDTLVLLALRERGSARFELWSVDATTGERRWERVLEARDPLLDDVSDTGTFAVVVQDTSLLLIEQRGDPEALTYEQIGLRDGVSRTRTTLGVADPGDSIRGVVWGRDRFVLVNDALYTFELATGSVQTQWP